MIGLFLSFLYYPSVNFIDVADLTRIIGRFLFNFHYIIGQLSGLRKAFSILAGRFSLVFSRLFIN